MPCKHQYVLIHKTPYDRVQRCIFCGNELAEGEKPKEPKAPKKPKDETEK